MTRKTDKRCFASFTKPIFPSEEAHNVSPLNIPLPPPPQLTHPRLRNAIWLAFLLHTCILTTDTLISPSQLIWQRDYHDNGFSTWLICISVCFFCLYSLHVIVLVMKVLWKNRSDVNWINAKEFSENSWEMTLGFPKTILQGNLARSREYEQYRNQKQRQQKGEETKIRYEVTKK